MDARYLTADTILLAVLLFFIGWRIGGALIERWKRKKQRPLTPEEQRIVGKIVKVLSGPSPFLDAMESGTFPVGISETQRAPKEDLDDVTKINLRAMAAQAYKRPILRSTGDWGMYACGFQEGFEAAQKIK